MPFTAVAQVSLYFTQERANTVPEKTSSVVCDKGLALKMLFLEKSCFLSGIFSSFALANTHLGWEMLIKTTGFQMILDIK